MQYQHISYLLDKFTPEHLPNKWIRTRFDSFNTFMINPKDVDYKTLLRNGCEAFTIDLFKVWLKDYVTQNFFQQSGKRAPESRDELWYNCVNGWLEEEEFCTEMIELLKSYIERQLYMFYIQNQILEQLVITPVTQLAIFPQIEVQSEKEDSEINSDDEDEKDQQETSAQNEQLQQLDIDQTD